MSANGRGRENTTISSGLDPALATEGRRQVGSSKGQQEYDGVELYGIAIQLELPRQLGRCRYLVVGVGIL